MDAYMTGNPVPQPAYHWPVEEVKESTLLSRHLPEAIPHETFSRLLSNYGATSIHPCTSGRMRNCAFVDFKDEGLAHQAQQHLNGAWFLGNTLAVERASRSTEKDKNRQSERWIGDDSVSLIKDAAAKQFGGGYRAGPHPGSEPIAERLWGGLSISSSPPEAPNDGGPKQKRIRHEAILGPALDKDVAHEAVGLRAAALVPKEMPVVKKKNPIIQIKVAPKQVQNEEKGDASAMSLAVEEKQKDHNPFTTLEELKSGGLPPEEILSLPMFKSKTQKKQSTRSHCQDVNKGMEQSAITGADIKADCFSIQKTLTFPGHARI